LRLPRCAFILAIFLANTVFGQDTLLKITGKVIDDVTKLPLRNVSVQITGTLKGTTTDSNGVFKFSVKENKIVLEFSIIGYETKFISANYTSYNKLVIPLSQKTQQLKEVVINSSPIEAVIKSENSNVLDYEFYKDNILLITYVHDLKKSKLILINQSFDTISKTSIPEEPTGLFKDCLGNNHVVCQNTIYQVYLENSTLKLYPPEKIENFEQIMYPCVAQDSANLYFLKKEGAIVVDVGAFRPFNSHSHTISYSYVNKLTKKKSSLADIVDEEVEKKRKDELDYEKGKMSAGMYEHGSPARDRLFFETIVIKEIFAPLYNIQNKIYVFDFVNYNIQRYEATGELLSKVNLKFQHQLNWKRQMCIDEKSGKVFAIFEKNGVSELKEINLITGEINNSYKIPFAFIKQIKAYDNYIYFLYKGKEYDDTRCLSRLRLN
jgi:hypothetical protein